MSIYVVELVEWRNAHVGGMGNFAINKCVYQYVNWLVNILTSMLTVSVVTKLGTVPVSVSVEVFHCSLHINIS